MADDPNPMTPISQWEDDGGAINIPFRHQPAVNVSAMERALSAYVGASLVSWGVPRRSVLGLVSMVVGGTFLYRAATGHCPVYGALQISTAKAGCGSDSAIHVRRASTDAPCGPEARPQAPISAPIAVVVERESAAALAARPLV